MIGTGELEHELAYIRLSAITTRLADGLRAAAEEAGCAVQVVSVTGLVSVFFSEQPVGCFADVQRCDLAAHAAWCRELLSRGVYPPPSQFEAWFPSLAHTEEQIERTLNAASAAFACLPEREVGA